MVLGIFISNISFNPCILANESEKILKLSMSTIEDGETKIYSDNHPNLNLQERWLIRKESQILKTFGRQFFHSLPAHTPLFEIQDIQKQISHYRYFVSKHNSTYFMIITSWDYPELELRSMVNEMMAYQQIADIHNPSLLKNAFKKYMDMPKKKIVDLMAQVEELKNKLNKNIDMQLNHLHHTEKLLSLADDLNESAQVFKRKGKKLKRRWWLLRLFPFLSCCIT